MATKPPTRSLKKSPFLYSSTLWTNLDPFLHPFTTQGIPAAPASTVREKLQAEGKDVAIPQVDQWDDSGHSG